MKSLLIAFSFLALSVTTIADAAPTRTSHSSGLFLAYTDPKESEDGYSDKFYITDPSEDKNYTVTYNTDDPILMASLVGGKITTFERTESVVTITFRSSFSGSKSDDALYLQLFTDSRMNFALNEDGLKEALTGAFFSSKFGRASTRPVYFDEGYIADEGAHRIAFTTYSSTSKSIVDTFYAFLPASALAYINSSVTPSASEVVVRQYSGKGFEASLGTRVSKEDTSGATFAIPVNYSGSTSFAVIDLSLVKETTLFAPTNTLAAGSKVALATFVKDCPSSSSVKLEKKAKGASKFSSVGSKKLKHCAAQFVVNPRTTTAYRFKSLGTTHKKTVKIK